MVDYVKVRLRDITPSELENNPLLTFYDQIEIKSGQIRSTNKDGKPITAYREAEYQDLVLRIYDSGTILMMGSLHKYWNQGKHNYNDFSKAMLIEVLDNIEKKFGISPVQMELQGLEFGVNILPPYPTIEILNNLMNHAKERFKNSALKGKGEYEQAKHTQYYIKVYDKAMQYRELYDVKGDILRFEVKYIKMEKLKAFKIKTLEDVVNSDYQQIGEALIKEWERILFYDFTINSNKTALLNYKNPNYWFDLIKNRKSSAYNKHRIILKDITDNSSEGVQNQISNLIRLKSIELSGGVRFDRGRKTYRGVRIDQDAKCLKKKMGVRIDPLVIRSNDTPLAWYKVSSEQRLKLSVAEAFKNRKCWVTGVDISMQKEESYMVYITALKHYYNNDKETYHLLERKFLPGNWENASLEKQWEEIAHAIRKRSETLQKKQRRLYRKDQLQIF